MTQATTQRGNGNQQSTENVPALAAPRLPYHPAIEERFGVDKASWKALVEAIFPMAQATESVILALSYCRARSLDPFKKNVHIVPIWDSNKGRMVDTIWPGIGELRTTAFRTKQYAGRDATEFGEDQDRSWEFKPKNGPARTINVTFPEWAQVTVYRLVGDQRVAFQGPRVYWLETYSTMGKSDAPNSMWERRPRGQLDKCAEAAALRAAFPEEMGDSLTDAEAGVVSYPGGIVNQDGSEAANNAPPAPGRHKLDPVEPREPFDAEQAAAADDPRPTQEEAPQEAPDTSADPDPEPPTDEDADTASRIDQIIQVQAEVKGVQADQAEQAIEQHCGQHFKAALRELNDDQLDELAKQVRANQVIQPRNTTT